jgi:hypothetical protein
MNTAALSAWRYTDKTRLKISIFYRKGVKLSLNFPKTIPIESLRMKFRLAITMNTAALSAWRYAAKTRLKISIFYRKDVKLSLNFPKTIPIEILRN